MTRTRKRRIAAAIAAVAAAAAIAAVFCGLWASGAFLPSWTAWDSFSLEIDLDKDGDAETMVLADRHLAIRDAEGAEAYRSPDEWHVFDATAADIDRDGALETVALVWKRGSFGEARPFWIEKNDEEFSQHIFVFRYGDGALEPVWMSSAVDFEIRGGYVDERERLHIEQPDGGEILLEWDSWGFAFLDESAQAAADAAALAPDGAGAVTLAAAGDVIPHELVVASAWDDEERAYDFSALFAPVAGLLGECDLAAVNQEAPFAPDDAHVSDYPLFGAPAALCDALAAAGFDIVTAATNHALDQGAAGVMGTIEEWRAYPQVTLLGLHASATDADAVAYRKANDMRFALFNLSYGLNAGPLGEEDAYLVDTLDDEGRILGQLQAVERDGSADLSVCFVHAGEEYAAGPTEEQRALAERLIDAGADAVICTHAHVVQPCETVSTPAGNKGIVCWSLGNFAASQGSPETSIGAVALLAADRDGKGLARFRSCRLVPSICHIDRTGDGGAVYLLSDYTEELARANAAAVPSADETVSLHDLWRIWHAWAGA